MTHFNWLPKIPPLRFICATANEKLSLENSCLSTLSSKHNYALMSISFSYKVKIWHHFSNAEYYFEGKKIPQNIDVEKTACFVFCMKISLMRQRHLFCIIDGKASLFFTVFWVDILADRIFFFNNIKVGNQNRTPIWTNWGRVLILSVNILCNIIQWGDSP